VDPDGANKTPLPGDQSQTQLWETMFSYLDRAYEGDAKKALKELRSILNQLDRIDSQATEIRGRVDKEIEKRGPDSDKLPKMEEQLAKLDEERKKFLDKELELRRSALVEAKPEAKAEGEKAKDADPKAGGADAK
jgi:chromosome segregation ATPase